MLQVLATVMADPPAGAGLGNWRDAKARLVRSLTPLTPEHTVRGQYEGYHDVEGRRPRNRRWRPTSRSGWSRIRGGGRACRS